MFYEDINTLYEKYKYCSFWYELSYDDIVDNVDCMVDFIEVRTDSTKYVVTPRSKFCIPSYYVDESNETTEHSDEENINVRIIYEEEETPTIVELSPNQSIYLFNYIDYKYVNSWAAGRIPPFVPISPMNVVKCGSESNTVKVYLKPISQPFIRRVDVGTGKYVGDSWSAYMEDDVYTSEDSGGEYIELTANRDGDEFTIIGWAGYYFCGKILNYKSLPEITFNTLYRGNTQTVEVYFDGELIDSKYYDLLYQNQVLSDGKITIGEDTTNLELEIYLKHPEYISTKLKYDLPIDWYTFNSQEELENGIEMGLSTLRADGTVRLENITVNNVKLNQDPLSYRKQLICDSCIFNNVIFDSIDFLFVGDNITQFNNCDFKRSTLKQGV